MRKRNKRWIFVLLGPLAFIILELIGKPESMEMAAYHTLAVTAWIAIWWITEAIPIAVTALLPIVMFPLTGALDLSSTTESYGHKYVFLYMGGFILAMTIEKWNLHRRIALNIISFIGTNMVHIILGFIIATGFMSMWISNTATSVMMLPIGMAIVSQLKSNGKTPKKDAEEFGKALMLAIAYSASIGGMATLIGTPPNLVFAGVVQETYGIEITFTQWLMFGAPVSLILLFTCWYYLTKIAFNFKKKAIPGGKEEISELLRELGAITREEKYVLAVFVTMAFCWITRDFLLAALMPAIDDTIIAMAGGILIFLLPSGKKGKPLLTWSEGVKLPWGIIILFGGGLAIASAFKDTGLAFWIGNQLSLLEGLPLFFLVVILIFCVNFLTEMTSNLATTAMLLPILAPMAVALAIHPFMLMVSATVAASCAFMLPVATPPNAVVFGSGYLRIPDMIRTGIWMNLASVIILSLIVYFMLPYVWQIDPFFTGLAK